MDGDAPSRSHKESPVAKRPVIRSCRLDLPATPIRCGDLHLNVLLNNPVCSPITLSQSTADFAKAIFSDSATNPHVLYLPAHEARNVLAPSMAWNLHEHGPHCRLGRTGTGNLGRCDTSRYPPFWQLGVDDALRWDYSGHLTIFARLTQRPDTIYACQDRRDDVKAGVKSTAVLLGDMVLPFCKSQAFVFVISLFLGGRMNQQSSYYTFVAVGGSALHLLWQYGTLSVDSPSSCGRKLRISTCTPAMQCWCAHCRTVLAKWLPGNFALGGYDGGLSTGCGLNSLQLSNRADVYWIECIIRSGEDWVGEWHTFRGLPLHLPYVMYNYTRD